MRRSSKSQRTILESIEPRLFLASIAGTIFNDLDGNGARDAEPALSNWTVFLDQNRDHVLNNGELSVLTNGSGQYTFSDLEPGNYTVAMVVPPGWQQTSPGGAPAFSPFVASNQSTTIPTISRRVLDSDAVRSAIIAVSDLSSYTTAQLRAARSWVVGMVEGADINALAGTGPISIVQTPLIEDTYILKYSERTLGTNIASRLAAAAGLSFFYPLVANDVAPRSIPNDTLFPNQWHLLNTGQTAGTPGADANVTSVWDTYKGDGVTIAVVDEGMEYTHEDLSPNYSAASSYDYFSNDTNPAAGSFEDHATAVGGVAAGRGFNGIGVSGAAPNATLAALRLFSAFSASSDSQEAGALSHLPNSISIYNNSWGPSDNGTHIEGPGPLTAAVLQNGALTGRSGLGSIFVWAAGNGKGAGGLQGDNVNYDGYANSRYVIAVSAIDHNAIQSYYSEPGAPILVAAYSDGNAGIVTTDRAGGNGYSSGSYTSVFGGTSSASPLAAGVIALMLQANPNLGWRDVQQILAYSAVKNHVSDTDWTNNGAGLHVNHKYGFGAVDAAAAVALAENWTNVGPEQLVTSGTLNVNTFIPDNDTDGLSRTFNVSSALRVESVEVVFNAAHATRGQLKLILTSPSGTQSVLSDFHNDTGDNWNNWVFTSRRHLDELAAGDWTLKVIDGTGASSGVWNSWKLNLYGTVPDSTVHYAVVNDSSSLTDRDFGAHDIASPTIAGSLFHFQTGQSITVQFSEDVAAGLGPEDLTLDDLTRSTTVPTASIAVTWNGTTNTATFTFPGFGGGILPDGNYRATVLASGIADLSGNSLLNNGSLDFFVLGGDANRDRKVDVEDLGILATNWQLSPRDFGTGDFDYSGTVDVNDLGILASNWQVNLPAPAAPFAAQQSTRKHALRVAAQVL